MKKLMIPILLTLCYSLLSCHTRTGCVENTYTKAVIYYNPKIAPWGLMRVIDVNGRDFLKNSKYLDQITLTNKDTLECLSDCLRRAHQDTAASDDYVDTSIAVLLYGKHTTDTLFSNAYPQSRAQFNNNFIQDSATISYIINIIKSHNIIWKERSKVFFYNGKYNALPKTIWNDSRRDSNQNDPLWIDLSFRKNK